MVGATTFVGTHIVRKLLISGHRVIASVRNVLEENALRDALSSSGDTAHLVDGIVFKRHFVESLESWASVLESHNDVILAMGPSPSSGGVMHSSLASADDSTLSNAFKSVDRLGIKRIVVTLHSGESLVDHTHRQRKSSFSTGLPWAALWSRRMELSSRNEAAAETAMFLASRITPKANVTVIVPFGVLGRPLGIPATGDYQMMNHLLSGKLRAIPDISLSFIDVEDLAQIAVNSLFAKGRAGKHELVVGVLHTLYLEKIVNELTREFPNHRISSISLPKFVLRLLSPVNRDIGVVLDSVGNHRRPSSTRAAKLLGQTAISSSRTISVSAHYALDSKILA